MKKLYYVVTMEYGDYGDNSIIFSGNKEISVYRIFDNEPRLFFTLDLEYEKNSEKEIKQYLLDTYQDEYLDAELIKL